MVVAAAAIALTGCSSTPSGLPTRTASPNAPVTAFSPVVVTIGDSIMKGHGLPHSQAWPELLGTRNGWKITNLACDGAGFATVGSVNDCEATFASLIEKAAELHPQIVLISGSSNDLGVEDGTLNSATITAMQSLRKENPGAKIIGISTVWGDTLTPDQINDINEQVRTAVMDVDGVYLDIGQPLAGHRDWLQSDDVHPTAHGQRALAKSIAGALRSAGVVAFSPDKKPGPKS